MGRPIVNLLGKKFGALTVIARSPNRLSSGAANWMCECTKCGKIVEKYYAILKLNPLSCGHCKKMVKRTTRPGESGRNALLGKYKQSARERNLEWKLTVDEFTILTTQDCVYCGQAPAQHATGTRGHAYVYSQFLHNGIDRIDSSTGYTIENTVSCCKQCNFAKRDLSLEEFRSWLFRVNKRLESASWP
jgi:glutaredoxin